MKSFQMKKLAASSIIAAAMFAATSGAQAATLDQTFDVSVDLAAACQIVGAPAPVLDFGVYTAFVGATGTPATDTFGIECTRDLAAPTYSFDGATGYGVLAGLNYLVSASDAITTPGTAATAVLGGIGSADTYTITLTGSMDPLQAGECAGATAAACAGVQTATRTLTVTY